MGFPCSHCKEQCSAEFLGTFLLVFNGAGIVAFTALMPFPYDLFVIAATFGATVGLVILAASAISGAHINPAVTFAQSLVGRLRMNRAIPYLVFQLAGGLAAGFVLRTIFPPSQESLYLGSTILTYGVGPLTGFLLEMAGTFLLVFVILCVSSTSLSLKYRAVAVGGTLFTLILIIGPLTGAGLNPARSIGPAVLAEYLENLEVYIAAPIAGATLAALTQKRLTKPAKKILFVCIENAGRSQMAEAFAKAYGGGRVEARSAGTAPAEHVNPLVVQVMKEKGIELADKRPRMLDPELARKADLIVVMGCNIQEACPAILLKGKKIVDWGLEDPKGKPVGKVREIRDQIEKLVKELLS